MKQTNKNSTVNQKKKHKTESPLKVDENSTTEMTSLIPLNPHNSKYYIQFEINIPEISNEVVVEFEELSARDKFIQFQKINRYSSSHSISYSVHIEGIEDLFRNNISNLHLLSLGRLLTKDY